MICASRMIEQSVQREYTFSTGMGCLLRWNMGTLGLPLLPTGAAHSLQHTRPNAPLTQTSAMWDMWPVPESAPRSPLPPSGNRISSDVDCSSSTSLSHRFPFCHFFFFNSVNVLFFSHGKMHGYITDPSNSSIRSLQYSLRPHWGTPDPAHFALLCLDFRKPFLRLFQNISAQEELSVNLC